MGTVTMSTLIPKHDFVDIERVAHLAAGGETPALRAHIDAAARFLSDKTGGMPGREQMYLVAARVKQLVFGARDLRFGGVRSKFGVADSELLNHRVEIIEGVLAVECVELLQRFFAGKRP